MNTAKVAAALNTISLAFGELAEALVDAPQPIRTAQDAPEPSPFVDIPEEVFQTVRTDHHTAVDIPQGSLTICPKHHIPYTEGQYGPYCKSTTDDPAWGKQKGDRLWCRITPKNAADWLRITAA